MEPNKLKNLAQIFIKQYFPEYLDRVDRIWGMLDEIDFDKKDAGNNSQALFSGGTLGFAAGASPALREVVSGLVAIRVTYEQEKNAESIPLLELQKLISETCEQLKISPDVKLKLEKITVDFGTESSEDKIVNEISGLKKTIQQEHAQIRRAVRRPVISGKHKHNCLVSLYPASREVVIDAGGKQIPFELSRVRFELFQAIAGLNKKNGSWAKWEDIGKAVPTWSTKEPTYIRHRINELREYLPSDFADLINGQQGLGYRIETHPDNIILKPE